MLASLIIVFREVLEAGLIVGIVLATTVGVPRRGRWIGAGLGAGLAGAVLVALFADRLAAQFAGNGQELFNAAILLTAVGMLAWHNIWMARHGRELTSRLKAVGRAVGSGEQPPLALAVVVGVAVLREGSEVVLFLAGIAASDSGGTSGMIVGSLGGVVLGALAALLMYGGLLRVPARHLFSVTTWLITLLAAGMAAQAMGFLYQAGVVTVGADQLWDTSALLRDTSIPGRVLHVMVGYTDRPSEIQALAYALVVAAVAGLTRIVRPRPASSTPRTA